MKKKHNKNIQPTANGRFFFFSFAFVARRLMHLVLLTMKFNKSEMEDAMKMLLWISAIFTLITSTGCVSDLQGFPVKQSGVISSYPSGADLYLSEENSDKESYLGKTPQTISLVSERRYQWQIKAAHEPYEPLVWHIWGGKEIDHHFVFQDWSKTEQERIRKALMAKRDQFLQYGFDVLDFVNYAKANLKVRGEINFGGVIPEIDFRTFKNKEYVEVKANYLVTYNTLKVSMYDAASMTFDEIVKKLAIKIMTDFKKQDAIAGFIFKVTYTNKDFSEKNDWPRNVTNEFILPKEACGQYAALDITNQDLIDHSIVLVDGERIALRLQHSK